MKLITNSESLKLISHFLQTHPDGVIEILGPTASGKTGFSIEVAKHIESTQKPKNQRTKCEIISVDSRQIYIGCDISAAKISKEEMQGIPHHGIDLVNMDEPFNAKQFQTFAFEKIEEIKARGNVPMLCGGTMLWLDAVSENYVFSEDLSPDHTEEEGDRGRYQKSDKKSAPRYPFLKIGLHWERDLLYQRINQRAVEQFESGLIEETKALLDKYQIANSKNQKPSLHPNVATSFGYLEIEQYLQGLMTYEECLTKNQQRNRNYAKRQLTWWRGREDIVWIDGNTTT